MKILFTIADANLKGGTEILAFNLLHGLNAEGLECRLLSVTPYRGSDDSVVSLCDEDYEKWKPLQANPFNKLMGSRRSESYLKRLIADKAKELGAEWIINHTYDMCAAIPTDGLWRTAQVFNWSIRGYESSLQCIINKKGPAGRVLSNVGLSFQTAQWHKALPHFNRLVVLTDAGHAEVKDVCPSAVDEQIVTIPDPLMQTEDSNVRTSLQNKDVVFVGRLSHEKGAMRLLRIWERIIKSLPDYILSIYGTGDMRKEMEEYIAGHCLKGVRFMGYCDRLEDIYTNADLLLMTSDSEGFGMVLIEAMYYGVPCISFDCPISPKEIISDAGVTVSCFDEERYADEVINLLSDSERMNMLQNNAIKQAREYYINKIVKSWINLANGYE